MHVPLPGDLYEELRTAASETRRPATELAREAIQTWLLARRRDQVSRDIARYAEEWAGTWMDLDPSLEVAGLELWSKAQE